MSEALTRTKPKPAFWKLALVLFPFVASAVAINLFLLGLLGQSIGLQALAPGWAVVWAIPLGLPVTWAAARWVLGLISQAER